MLIPLEQQELPGAAPLNPLHHQSPTTQTKKQQILMMKKQTYRQLQSFHTILGQLLVSGVPGVRVTAPHCSHSTVLVFWSPVDFLQAEFT